MKLKVADVTRSYIAWKLIDGERFGNFEKDIPQKTEKLRQSVRMLLRFLHKIETAEYSTVLLIDSYINFLIRPILFEQIWKNTKICLLLYNTVQMDTSVSEECAAHTFM
jgi:hypothetical protein